MQVFHNLKELKTFKRAVVTIGSFDGVHLGHQKILAKVKQLAKDCGGESVVITFYPHPRHFLNPRSRSLQLINTIEEKKKLFEQFNIDNLVIVPFNEAFANQSADDYIMKFLYDQFKPSFIVIGYDHRFGYKRKGDIEYLKWHSQTLGFEIVEIARQDVDDIGISSTKIRKAIKAGDIIQANKLLGYNFQLSGQVVSGNKIGRSIGYPTANIEVRDKRKIIPNKGVYAVKVTVKGHLYEGMLYVGSRPTIDKKRKQELRIEVNIFDFDADIYSEPIDVEFIAQTRGDIKFEHIDELKEQLGKDKEACLKILKEEQDQLSLLEEQIKDPLPKAAVVILNYNTAHHLAQFLPTVIEHTPKEVEIVVVDNGSTDDSVALMKQDFPAIRLIINPENYGFAGGYNHAIQRIDTEILVLLNSDIEVKAGWIEPVLSLMKEEESVAVAQPKILSQKDPKSFEYAGAAGGFLDQFGYPFCRGRIYSEVEEDWGQYEEQMDVFWASGAAFFIRKKIFDHLQGFDESYFAHMEEIDLCWRIKRAGYRIVAVPSAQVHHLGGGTLAYGSSRKTFLNVRNSLYTLLKNERGFRLFKHFLVRLFLDGLGGIFFMLKLEFKHTSAIIKAHWEVFPRIKQRLNLRKVDDNLIERIRIDHSQDAIGRYKGSIILTFFLSNRKKFRDLRNKPYQ